MEMSVSTCNKQPPSHLHQYFACMVKWNGISQSITYFRLHVKQNKKNTRKKKKKRLKISYSFLIKLKNTHYYCWLEWNNYISIPDEWILSLKAYLCEARNKAFAIEFYCNFYTLTKTNGLQFQKSEFFKILQDEWIQRILIN